MRTSKSWLLCLALLGCEMAPDELVVLAGQALDADLTPRSSAQVEVGRGEQSFSMSESQVSFEPWTTVETGADGWFFVELRGRDLDSVWAAGAGENLRKLHRLAITYPSGARVTATAEIDGGDNALPPFVPWEAEPMVREIADGLVLSWPPLPPQQEPFSMAAEYAVLLRSDDRLLWFAPASDAQAEVPAIFFEDFPRTKVSALATAPGSRAWFPLNGRSAVTHFRFFWEAAPKASEITPVVPFSRGVSCLIAGQPQATCSLTDGDLTEVRFPEGTQEIEFRFEAARSFSRILLRDLRIEGSLAELSVDGSDDGVSWNRLGFRSLQLDEIRWALPDSGLFVELPLSQNRPVQRLRIQSAQPIAAAAEVSVF